ncbi:MAG: GGDEF domain-containing protein [Bacillota bacterium]
MVRRIARWYPWIAGSLGLAFLAGRLFIGRSSLPGLFKGEYLALLATFAVLETNRIPVRAGAAVGFSTAAVVAAVIIGGDLPAMALSLGGLATWATRKRSARSAVFNAGVYASSAAAGSLVASLMGYPIQEPWTGLSMAGPLVFTAAYSVLTAVLVGLHSVTDSRGARAVDHMYNLGLHLANIVISTSLGTSAALAYRTLGAASLYLMCVTLSVIAFLISLAYRVVRNREGLFGLYQAASSINEALTLREVFERAHKFSRSLLEEDFAWLSLPTGDSEGGLAVAYTWAKDGVDLERAAAHVMMLRTAGEDRRPGDQFVWARDHNSRGQTYFGWVTATPLHLGKQFLGEFGLASLSTPQEVSSDKLQLLAVLSSHLALAVDNALKFERATMLAFTDPLTGLYNYRQFQNLLREAIVRAEKAQTPVSLIYVDLDHFREVNNTYGHQVGDDALREIGKAIRASCRDKDFICRPGGDEFTVVLPGVPKDRARVVASRIKENLVAVSVDVGLPQPLTSAIGASVGVATYPEDGSDVDTLVKKADADMYSSKLERGRGGSAT